jgi:hypothetical protein
MRGDGGGAMGGAGGDGWVVIRVVRWVVMGGDGSCKWVL